jgi:putative heme-binding domain-containing protein
MWKLLLPVIFAHPMLFAAETGESLFLTHCAACHGPKGDGGRGSNLAVRCVPHAPDDAALFAITRDGIPGTQMPATRMTDDERTLLVAYVRSLGRSQVAQVSGDRSKGESLFWSRGNCGQCHTVGGRGGRLGPDLTEIGTKRGAANLRISILDPEAEVPDTYGVYRRYIFMPDNFLQVRVVTKDGRRITGIRVNEDAFTIQLRDFSDHLYSFRKDELQELNKDWGKSPMPSYKGVFSESELQDVIAYLVSLQGAQ